MLIRNLIFKIQNKNLFTQYIYIYIYIYIYMCRYILYSLRFLRKIAIAMYNFVNLIKKILRLPQP